MELEFSIAGKQVSAPLNWNTININGNYNGILQERAMVQSTVFIWVNDAAITIIDELKGEYGAFQGIPCTISTGGDILFDGYLAINDSFEVVNPVKVTAQLVSYTSNDELMERLSSITWTYAIQKGYILQNADFNGQVMRIQEDWAMHMMVFGLQLTRMRDLIENVSYRIDDARVSWGNVSWTNPLSVATAVWKTTQAILSVTQAILSLVETYKAFEKAIPHVEPRKMISLQQGMVRAFQCVGLQFDSSEFPELLEYKYLPSGVGLNIQDRINHNGYPQPNDYGYIVGDFVRLVLRLFNGRLIIDNNKVHMVKWNSTQITQLGQLYQMPDILHENYKYNVPEISNTTTFSFRQDFTDIWVLRRFKKSFVEHTITANKKRNDLTISVKGLDEIELPLTRGTYVNDELGGFLTELVLILGTIRRVFVGFTNRDAQKSDYSKANKAVVVGTYNFGHPKLVRYRNGQPIEITAKDLYVSNYQEDKKAQKIIYTGVKIPFTLLERNTLLKTGLLTNFDGKLGRLTGFNWNIGKDYAVIDYYVYENYTNNYIEVINE